MQCYIHYHNSDRLKKQQQQTKIKYHYESGADLDYGTLEGSIQAVCHYALCA